ncbi:hypothetical protein ACVWZX_001207 [Deinococcus sp. UYEF24]
MPIGYARVSKHQDQDTAARLQHPAWKAGLSS